MPGSSNPIKGNGAKCKYMVLFVFPQDGAKEAAQADKLLPTTFIIVRDDQFQFKSQPTANNQ